MTTEIMRIERLGGLERMRNLFLTPLNEQTCKNVASSLLCSSAIITYIGAMFENGYLIGAGLGGLSASEYFARRIRETYNNFLED
jgi:hypothetical protein